MIFKEALSFDDVMLVPSYSTLESRSNVDVSVNANIKNKSFTWNHPIIPANMLTVSGRDLVIENCRSGGLSILNRFISLEDQLSISEDMINYHEAKDRFGISVGIKQEDKDNISKFFDLGVRIFCIDIAHGDSKMCVDMTDFIKNKYPQSLVIAGNVATKAGAVKLWSSGADIVKIGIGGGSLCTTRIETGNGVPQLTAIMDIADAKTNFTNKYFISDGGLKSSGDICKALCFADMVMVGNLFAGCEETPGNQINIDGRTYKEYAGSSTHKTNHIEGVVAMVPYKGKFNNILTKLLEGLKSGLSYQGVNNLTELKQYPEFVKITSAGLRESHPHDVWVK